MLKRFTKSEKKLSVCLMIVSVSKHASFQGEGIKILTPKQRLQRLPIALAQVKAGNTSENLLNNICQMIHSFYQMIHSF